MTITNKCGEPMPSYTWAAAPCPDCGALDMDEANEKCRPTSDETGERYCGGEFNDAGISVQPTAESLAAIDAWIAREVSSDAAHTKVRSGRQSGLGGTQ